MMMKPIIILNVCLAVTVIGNIKLPFPSRVSGDIFITGSIPYSNVTNSAADLVIASTQFLQPMTALYQFSWQGDQSQFSFVSSCSMPVGFSENAAVDGDFLRFISGDFDGDGFEDVAVLNLQQWPGVFWMCLSSSRTSFWESDIAKAYSDVAGSSDKMKIVVGDFDHNGFDDIAALCTSVHCPPLIQISRSNGTAFRNDAWSSSLFTKVIALGSIMNDLQLIALDLNGDGKCDLAAVRCPSVEDIDLTFGWSNYIFVEISTGSSFTSMSWQSQLPSRMLYAGTGTNIENFGFLTGDFDNNGMADIAVIHRNMTIPLGGGWDSYIFLQLSFADHFQSHGWNSMLSIRSRSLNLMWEDVSIFAVDVNRDNRTDLVMSSRYGRLTLDGEWLPTLISVDFSVGNNFYSVDWTPLSVGMELAPITTFNVIPLDINKDGYIDLVGVPIDGIDISQQSAWYLLSCINEDTACQIGVAL